MNRIVMISGANSGIGKAATRRFAEAGYQVVMACRSLERAEPVRDAIAAETGSDTIDLMRLDTSSRESIQAFVSEFSARYPRLDVLVNNAAYVEHGRPYRLGPDGVEITFATNVLGPYRLIQGLLPTLRRSGDARIINIGSNIIKHFFNPKLQLDFDALHGLPEGADEPSVYQRYCRSKMALLMLTFEFARRLEADGVSCTYLHVNGAKLSRETIAKMTLPYRILGRLQSVLLRKPEYMAENYYALAADDRFRGVSGVCINDRREVMQPGNAETATVREQIMFPLGRSHYPAYADNRELQSRVWEVCELCEVREADDVMPESSRM